MSAGRGGKPGPGRQTEEKMPAERAEIIAWLEKVKFRHALFGGVKEADLWKKIAELDTLYTKALEAERIRYNVLLEEYRRKTEERFRADPASRKGGDPDG